MHPAFSVIFLTTLIGAGQGLFLALFTGQFYSLAHLIPALWNTPCQVTQACTNLWSMWSYGVALFKATIILLRFRWAVNRGILSR